MAILTRGERIETVAPVGRPAGPARRQGGRRDRPLRPARPDQQPRASGHAAGPAGRRGDAAQGSLRRDHRGARHGRRSAPGRRPRPRRPGRRDPGPRHLLRRADGRAGVLRGSAHPRRDPGRRGRRGSVDAGDRRRPPTCALAVAEARGTGATAIKIYADLPGPLVAAITREAHRQGMLVWAHAAVFPASPGEVIDAGADTVSHTCMLAYQASPAMPRAYAHRSAGRRSPAGEPATIR